MKKISLLFLALLMSGCATRTLYKPQNESGGYSEALIKDNFYISRFAGNAYTKAATARALAQFRAVEVCHEKGFKVAKIIDIKDKTTSKTVQRTSSFNYQQPTYFSGTANTNTNYNYYGGNTLYSNSNTNVSGTVYGGNAYGNSVTWDETYHFPMFDVLFSCHDDIYLAGLKLKTLNAEDIKEYAKDKLGGLQVIGIGNESPNNDIVQIGDIILKINNIRVLDVPQMTKAIDSSTDKDAIPANIVREGKSKVVRIKAKDYTDLFMQWNREIVRNACTASDVKSRPICAFRNISSEH